MEPTRKFIRFSKSSRWMVPPLPPQPRRYKRITEILTTAKHTVVECKSYSDVICEQCRSGDWADELLLCDKCNKGFHMNCPRPIVVKVPMGSWLCPKCVEHRRVRRFRRRRSSTSSGSKGPVVSMRNAGLLNPKVKILISLSLVFLVK